MIEDEIHPVGIRPRLAALADLRVEEAGAVLRRHWPSVAASAVAGAALLYGASTLIPKTFVASAEIFVDPRTIQPLNATPGQEDSNGEIIFVESQALIIGSESVLKRVVAAENLDADPEFGGGASGRTALATLADHVTVRRPERTFVLDVSVKASTADKAARLANAVTTAYFAEQAAARTAMARRASTALTDRLDDLRERLRQAEERADAFRRSHGLVGTRTTLVSEQQLTDATTQLAVARSRVVAAQARVDEVKRLGAPAPGTSPEAIVSPTVTLLRGQQAEAKRRLDGLLAQLGPLHPMVRDAEFQVAGVNRGIANELARIAQSAQIEFQRATAAETAQRAIVADLSGRASDASAAITQAGEYDREVDVNKNLLNTFLSRARETNELERLDTTDARLISAAQPPHARSFPPRGSLFAAFGALLGLAAGMAQAWIRDGRTAPARAPAPMPAPIAHPAPLPDRSPSPVDDPVEVATPARRLRRLAEYGT